jgi:hypothetical protein
MKAVIPSRSTDTSADAERVQTALLRDSSIAQRLAICWSLSASVIGAARSALARSLPGASRREIDLRFVEVHYGKDLAAAVRDDLAHRDRDSSPEA